jgi:SAM-dependent methyltransferase
MPFFNNPGEAKRYAQNRPYFHPLAIERVTEVFEIETPYMLAVDIACGTGQSTTALTAIAERVIGFDISWNMLKVAQRNEHCGYIQAQAESMSIHICRNPTGTTKGLPQPGVPLISNIKNRMFYFRSIASITATEAICTMSVTSSPVCITCTGAPIPSRIGPMALALPRRASNL